MRCTATLAQTIALEINPSSITLFCVDEMNCWHCVGIIQRALKAGLESNVTFSIDLENQRVTVDGDPVLAASLIRDVGYEPVPLAT